MLKTSASRVFLTTISIIAVFLANQRLETDLKFLSVTLLVGTASVIILFVIRFFFDCQLMPAIAHSLWWGLVYACSCLLPLGQYLRKNEADMGSSAFACMLLAIVSASFAVVIWFSLPSDSEGVFCAHEDLEKNSN